MTPTTDANLRLALMSLEKASRGSFNFDVLVGPAQKWARAEMTGLLLNLPRPAPIAESGITKLTHRFADAVGVDRKKCTCLADYYDKLQKKCKELHGSMNVG